MTRHAKSDSPAPGPLRPFVTVTIPAEGDAAIRVDGRLYASGPIERAAIPAMLKAICEELQADLDVVITEADGSQASIEVFHRPPSRFAPPEPTPVLPPRPAPPALHRIEGAGFVPGEDVGIAVVLRSGTADGTGRAAALVEDRELPEGHHGVLLFGFISGTLHLEGVS